MYDYAGWQGGGGGPQIGQGGRRGSCPVHKLKKNNLSFWVWFEFSPMPVMVAQRIRPLGFVHLLLTVEIFVQAPAESEKHGESQHIRKLAFPRLCR